MFVKNKLNLLAISTVSVMLQSPSLKHISNDLCLLGLCKISFIVFQVFSCVIFIFVKQLFIIYQFGCSDTSF